MPSQVKKSPRLRAAKLVIPSILPIILIALSFIANPVSSCSCNPPQFPDVFQSAEFAAVIKMGDETMVNPKLLRVKEAQGERTTSSSASVASSTVKPPNLSPQSVKEPPCHFAQFRMPISGAPSNGAKKVPFGGPMFDFFNPSKVNFDFSNVGRVSPVSTFSKTVAMPQMADVPTGQPVEKKKVTTDHEREEPSVTTSILRSKKQQKVLSFDVLNILKVPSNSAKQILMEGIVYTNPGSSCFVNLPKNGKFIIWGKIISGKINLNICNSLQIESLTEEEKQIINSLEKEPMKQK